MYNPAKISSKRAPPVEPSIQYMVAVINTAMHYVNLQRISVFIYYTLKIREQNIQFAQFQHKPLRSFDLFLVIFTTIQGLPIEGGAGSPSPHCCDVIRQSTVVR